MRGNGITLTGVTADTGHISQKTEVAATHSSPLTKQLLTALEWNEDEKAAIHNVARFMGAYYLT